MKTSRKKLLPLLVLLALAGSSGIGCTVYGATYELDPVVVTASRIPEKLVDTKADISVVTRKQIEANHLQNLESMLRTAPGVQFLNYGSNGRNANLSGIRINGSNDVVILVDGVRVTDFQGANNSGYTYASLMSNTDGIERVEVLRGSQATVYGSGARGGVINIITRKIDGNHQTIDMSRGTGGRETYRFNSMGRYGTIGYNAYYNRILVGDTKDGSGRKWPGHTRTNAGGFKFSYDFNPGHTLSVDYDINTSHFHGEDFVYEDHYRGDYKSETFSIRDSWKFNDHWSNMFAFRHNRLWTNYLENYDNGSSEDPLGENHTYRFVTDQIHFHDSSNDFIAGIDYSHGKSNIPERAGFDEITGEPILKKHYVSNTSYFAQEEWRFLPGWSISGGIRYDRPSVDRWTPKFENHRSTSYKLSWDFTKKDTIFAGRNDYYILPGLDMLWMRRYGNPTLKPAEGRTTTIGYTHKFNDASAFTFNWFETKDKRVIGYSNATNHYQNFDQGIARGWNAQLLYQLGRDWNFNIGWAHLYQSVPGDNFSMGYYPKDKLTFDIVYTHNKWSVGFDGFYFIRRVNSKYQDYKKAWPADKYGVYNLAVNYRPNKYSEVYLKIDNIFNKLWAEHTDVLWNHEPGSWYSMPGRTYTLGTKLMF